MAEFVSELHQRMFETEALELFRAKMQAKLDHYRYRNPCSWKKALGQELKTELLHALAEDDMVSVANYAMMIDWVNGQQGE